MRRLQANLRASRVIQQRQSIGHPRLTNGTSQSGDRAMRAKTPVMSEWGQGVSQWTAIGRAADIPQHGTRLHGRQLIAISQQDKPRVLWQGFKDADHQRKIHHRGFVQHQQIAMEGSARVITRLFARPPAQQSVCGNGVGGQGIASRDGRQGIRQCLAQSGSRLAGGGAQQHALRRRQLKLRK